MATPVGDVDVADAVAAVVIDERSLVVLASGGFSLDAGCPRDEGPGGGCMPPSPFEFVCPDDMLG